MRTSLPRLLLAFALAWLLTACAGLPGQDPSPPRLLVFSGSTGYRHASIEAGVAAIRQLGPTHGFVVDATEDPAVFDSVGRLRPYRAILLLNTGTRREDASGEWFVGPRREALQQYLRGGGGIVGVHAAAASHYHWPWYRRMIGGVFARHPPGVRPGRLAVHRPDHPSLRNLPRAFERVDEWYYFDDLAPTTQVLITVDPASFGEPDVNPNPISWAHAFEGGRVFYTALGHAKESYSDPLFLAHLAGGVRWAMGLEPAPAR
jgi:type 1 glutamine amidotransferase